MVNNYKVYSKLDTNNCIIRVESTAFYDEQKLIDDGFVKIDEGSNGEIYGHAQPNYLSMKYGKTMYDEQFNPNFKYIDGNVIELTEEEKEVLFPKPKAQPSQEERIQSLESAMLEMVLGGI